MNLFSLKRIFYSPQTASTITPEELVHTDDPSSTQIVDTPYDCSKHYNLWQISLVQKQKWTQTPSDFQWTRKVLVC